MMSDAPKITVGRLKSRPQFLAVRAGEKRRGKYILLEVLDHNDPQTPPRVGFTVTKKHGNSVERNRMRRRLRAIGHELVVGGYAGADVVVRALAGSEKLSWSSLHEEITSGIQRGATR